MGPDVRAPEVVVSRRGPEEIGEIVRDFARSSERAQSELVAQMSKQRPLFLGEK
jgi:hypothetical protein